MKIEEAINKYKEAINRVYSEEEISNLCEKYPKIKHALLNIVPLLNIQPERSKREDCKCPVGERWTTGNPPTFIRKEKICRCGALNSMET